MRGAKNRNRTATGRGGALIATAVLATAIGAAVPSRAEQVGVAAQPQGQGGRIVLTWPQPVEFSFDASAQQVSLRFDRPVEGSFGAISAALPDMVSTVGVGPDGRTLVITTKRPVSARAFSDGSSVVVDVLGTVPGPQAQPASAPAPTGTQPAARNLPNLPVRTGLHDGYTRLLFNWKDRTDYHVTRDGNIVTVTFPRAAKVDSSHVDLVKPQRIHGLAPQLSGDQLSVKVTVPADARVRDFRVGNSVVLDVLDAHPSSAAPAQAAASAPQGQPMAQGPAAPAQPAPAAQPASSQPAGVQAKAPQPAAEQRSVQPPPSASPAARAGEEATAPSAAQLGGPPGAVGGAQGPSAPSVPVASARPVAQDPSGPASAVTLKLAEPAAAAVFQRAGYIYVVFDRRLARQPEIEVGPQTPRFGTVESAAVGDVTAMRFRMPPGVEPAVERDGNTWRVLLLTTRAPRAFSLPVESEPEFTLGPRILVRASGATRVVPFTDPEIGDELLIVPLSEAPQAVADGSRFPDVELVPTLQGVAIRPLRDGLVARPLTAMVEITAQGGLALSPTTDLRRVPRPGDAVRLFDIHGWRRGPSSAYVETRQQLLDAVVQAPAGDEREKRRIELARFYFAHGFAPETLGALDLVEMALPTAALRPEFRAMRGAARVWAGRPQEGLADLADKALDGDLEATLWRAAGEATAGNWTAARGGFSRAEAALVAYPDPFFTRFSLLAAEAALVANEPQEAIRLLDRLDTRVEAGDESSGASRFLRGLAEYQQKRTDAAAQLWALAAEKGTDRLARTRAEFALIDLELTTGKATAVQAMERLERLTFAWRGDELEIAIRRRLARLQIAHGEFVRGFANLKQLIEFYPDHPNRSSIDRELAETFARIFVEDGAAALSPLNALSFFDEWRHLLPSGRRGEVVIARLAERLVQVDLLDRAATLLEMQVRDRLVGPEKAAVGARLAAIRLLDNRPEEAAQAIEMSNAQGLSTEMVRERRLLYARALAELGRSEQALRLLDGDDSQPADFLRIDIAWRAQRWRDAERALAVLIGPPPKSGQIAPELRRALLNRAVALALSGDAGGLAALRRDFSAAMEGTPDFDTFRLMTRPEQATGLLDIRTIQQKVGEVDLFQNFLQEYRRRMGDAGRA
ncbi:MAG TPA: hypothetical protein VEY95_08750 [Azospirillaceae bacterium]|nr:hypothetical protein [Azospirillaceae bacterium]